MSITPTFLQVLLWNLHIMFVCIWSCAYAIFMSICLAVCLWTQFCPELPLLNHFPFCDQNLLYDDALVGGMIMLSDSSSNPV